jgi:hypothetical protein
MHRRLCPRLEEISKANRIAHPCREHAQGDVERSQNTFKEGGREAQHELGQA